MTLLNRLGSSAAVVGMAKNTGKTVTINYLIAKSTEEGRRVALTSSGLDGETFDSVSRLPKPAIFLPEGAWLATARGSLSRGTARLELAAATGFYNPLGEVMLARVRRAGTVEISGPERAGDMAEVIQSLSRQVDLVLVDGALDRRAVSAPGITESCILATGAVVAPTVEGVVRATAHQAGLLSLESWPGSLDAVRDVFARGELATLKANGESTPIPIETALEGPSEILDYLKEGHPLLVGGALTAELANLLSGGASQQGGLDIIVADGSRVFVDSDCWHSLRRRGGRIWAARSIRLAGITVNPVSPRGRQLPGQRIIAALSVLYPDIPVFDPLVTGGE